MPAVDDESQDGSKEFIADEPQQADAMDETPVFARGHEARGIAQVGIFSFFIYGCLVVRNKAAQCRYLTRVQNLKALFVRPLHLQKIHVTYDCQAGN